MKETKVYVDRDLLSNFYTRSGTDLGKRKWVQAEIVFYNVNNIYLYDIKTHDRELVKEVCDEIKNKLGSIEDILINLGNGKEDALNYFMHILNKTQKEYEK